MFNHIFLLIVATWTERVACCVDFDSDCALVDEIRNSAHVIILNNTKISYSKYSQYILVKLGG